MIYAFVLAIIMASSQLKSVEGKSLPLLGRSEELMEPIYPIGSDPVPCGFVDLSAKYDVNCGEKFVDSIFPSSVDGLLFTGELLLPKIASTCSHYELYRKCASCTAKQDCPDQREMMYNSLMEKWSIFCEKDQISPWLETVLQNGYRFNGSCDYTATMQFVSCFSKLDFPFNETVDPQMSLFEGIPLYQAMFSEMFKCTVGEILARKGFWEEVCGDTWQDTLLALWLSVSSLSRFGYHICQDEIQMLQDVRC